MSPDPYLKSGLITTEVDRLYDYIVQMTNLRLYAVGGALTAIGIVATIAKFDEWMTSIFVLAIAQLIIFTLVRVIANLNRAIYVLYVRIEQVERSQAYVGFATIWLAYVSDATKFTATEGFVLIAKIMARSAALFAVMVVSAPGIATALWKSSPFAWGEYRVSLAVPIIAAVLLLWIFNERHLARSGSPKAFVRNQREVMDEIAAEVAARSAGAIDAGAALPAPATKAPPPSEESAAKPRRRGTARKTNGSQDSEATPSGE